MTDLLGAFGAELSKNLAGRCLSRLALLGALYLGVFGVARALGHAHALDISRLVRYVNAWARGPAATEAGGQIVLLMAVVIASMATGLAARSLGAAIERVVLAADWRSWPRPARAIAARRTRRRQDTWDAAHRKYTAQWEEAARMRALNRPDDPGPRRAAMRARAAISAERPDRPTWSGDRIHSVSVRLRRDHRLDLAALWPHLWLMLSEQERREITAVRTEVACATELGAWAVLYALPAFAWWPAGVVAAVLVAAGYRRTRSAADAFARLVEAAVRLHTRELARHLGIEHSGPLPTDAGDRFGDLLGSAPPVVPSTEAEPGQDRPR